MLPVLLSLHHEFDIVLTIRWANWLASARGSREHGKNHLVRSRRAQGSSKFDSVVPAARSMDPT